jgi:antitoxin HicB
MTRFGFPAHIRRDGKAYGVRFRDLPECLTFGADRRAAEVAAGDALAEAIAGRISGDIGLPEPSAPRRGEVIVELPASMAAKAALYLALENAGISKAELARRLGVDEREVRRMLDPRHGTRLATLDAALGVLGKRLTLDLRDAAD